MKKVTKASLAKTLRTTASGEFFKVDIAKLQELKNNIRPDEKLRFHKWTGTRKHLRVVENFDIEMLKNFCEFSRGNDGRGGVDSDYIIVKKSEFKKLQKRLAWFVQ